MPVGEDSSSNLLIFFMKDPPSFISRHAYHQKKHHHGCEKRVSNSKHFWKQKWVRNLLIKNKSISIWSCKTSDILFFSIKSQKTTKNMHYPDVYMLKFFTILLQCTSKYILYYSQIVNINFIFLFL